MYSKIKKEYILEHIKKKLNSNNFNIKFKMGIDGLPIYNPVTDDNGNITDWTWNDEETYKKKVWETIPTSVLVSNGDYSVIRSFDGTQEINGAAFSSTLIFLVYAEDLFKHKINVDTIEQVRDMLLGDLGIIKGTRYNYIDKTQDNDFTWTVASHSDDLQIGSEIIINGKRYIEYMLNVDLDVSDNISYGNQYEFYIKTYSKQWVETTPEVYQNTKRTKIEVNQNIYDEVQIDLLPNAEETESLTCIKVTIQVNQETTYKYYKLEYMPDIEERVLPLVTSWGSSQGLSGFQMLRNNLLSPEQLEKSQLVHNVATTRGWAITFTFQLNDNKNAIVEMFSETLPRKDYLQRPYKLKALYKKKATNGEEVTFETLNKLSFETLLIPQEVATGTTHGDNIVFSISLAPKWGKQNE